MEDFRRITLVDAALTERVTVDVGLRFRADGRREVALPGLTIVEVKQAGRRTRRSSSCGALAFTDWSTASPRGQAGRIEEVGR